MYITFLKICSWIVVLLNIIGLMINLKKKNNYETSTLIALKVTYILAIIATIIMAISITFIWQD